MAVSCMESSFTLALCISMMLTMVSYLIFSNCGLDISLRKSAKSDSQIFLISGFVSSSIWNRPSIRSCMCEAMLRLGSESNTFN